MIINSLLIFFSLVVTAAILVPRDWRWTLFGLAMTYLFGFILIVQIWPLPLAAVKLLTGLIGVILLSTTKMNTEVQEEPIGSISSRIFILLLAILSWIIVLATISRLNAWLPIEYTNLFIGMVFLICGIIKFSTDQRIFNVIVGLLTLLSGFDIIYSSLEGSALVTALYALIVISICILGSYLEGIFSGEGEE
ncbi:hypothetical protein [Pelolinea submarina]|uniref:Uncharacterized protein n=1 Tax=Pelolinea submarina TaxID=913107 RepID=A0A347ZUH3_9CHLR|nr:hypothetical protein [Pelolinea submarina]REG10459.1 hypothetical protein DFR64_0317 [Pelolinea submarina]BBB48954.1 hypothetical protein Pelsub_P2185 [Pelolinea submarina]